MILLDASVWIDHMRRSEPRLAQLLADHQILIHPFMVGEIMLGSLAQRNSIIRVLESLPQAPVATHQEVLELIERERLYGIGIGYVDAHFLASARLADATVWTRDTRLLAAAEKIDLAYR